MLAKGTAMSHIGVDMNTNTMTNAQKFTADYKHAHAIIPNLILACYETGGFEDESQIVDNIQAKIESLKLPVPERVYIYDAIYHFEMPH